MTQSGGKHLWWSLLALGFNPEAVNSKHINLGPNMFAKPNKGAFHLLINFVLRKLNPSRYQEVYRLCWPVLNHKMDAEFRKVTCTWLREILKENVNTSLLLSPGGPKFIRVMLQLVKHAMLIELKTLNYDEGWFPEAVATPASSLELRVKRFQLVKRRFLRAALHQDDLLREYHRRSQALAKSKRELQVESLKYNELLKRYESNQESSTTESLKLVRSLSSTVDEMLVSSARGQEVLEIVLKGSANQHTLEGPDKALQIPPLLLEKVEQLPHQLRSGTLYQDGQMNLLGAMELFNHSLQILKEEQHLVCNSPKLDLGSYNLQSHTEQMACHLQDLRLIRQRISKEEIPDVQSRIQGLEAEMDRKWKELLKHLVSLFNKDSVPGLLSPISRLSFQPTAETTSSIFSQFPAKLLDKSEVHDLVQDGSLQVQSCHAAALSQPAVAELPSPKVNSSLDFILNTPPSPPLKAQSVPLTRVEPSCLTPRTRTPVQGSTRTKNQILDLESDNLANQFAEAVMISPKDDTDTFMNLEDILTSLRDPFSTRKRLLRTPDSLIQDVKNSWRKAVGSCEAEKNTSEFNGSLVGRLQPIRSIESPDCSPAVNQQEAFKSSLFWDTTCTDALDCSAVPFSLDHETLPELSSCDSLLSLCGEDSEMDASLLSPQPSLDTHAGLIRTPGTTNLPVDSPGLDSVWATGEPTSTTFSLDLDSLDLLPTTPSKKPEYDLPKLITFSPMDDMKCSL